MFGENCLLSLNQDVHETIIVWKFQLNVKRKSWEKSDNAVTNDGKHFWGNFLLKFS